MIIVTPTLTGASTDNKVFYAITRDDNPDKIILRSEQTNVETEFTIGGPDFSFTFSGDVYYNAFTITYDITKLTLNEDEDFQMTIYNGEDVIFKDKLFVTSQKTTIDSSNGQYSINKDNYLQYTGSTDDQYIVIQ